MNNIQLMNEGFDRQFTKARRLMEAHEAFKQYLDMLGKKNLLLKNNGGMGIQNAAHVVKSWANGRGTTVVSLDGLKAEDLGEIWLKDALRGAKGRFIWVSAYSRIPEELRKKYLYPFLQKGRIIATGDINKLNRDERNAFMVFDVSTMRGSKGQKWTESYKRRGLKEGFVKLNDEPIEIDYIETDDVGYVPMFKWGGETYYLNDFIRCHNNPWGEIDCPDYIHAYDSTNYYNPIFIGLDPSGEYVDIYEQSKMDESCRKRRLKESAGERYYCASYYGPKLYALEDNLMTNNYEVCKDFLWDNLNEGLYCQFKDTRTGVEIELDPDKIDDYYYEGEFDFGYNPMLGILQNEKIKSGLDTVKLAELPRGTEIYVVDEGPFMVKSRTKQGMVLTALDPDCSTTSLRYSPEGARKTDVKIKDSQYYIDPWDEITESYKHRRRYN